MTKRFAFFSSLILAFQFSFSQTVTEIFGKVIDAATKEPMSYVNVRLHGSLKATLTDPKGEYNIRTNEKVDTIIFSYLGYKTRSIAIKKGASQQLNIEMGSDDIMLKEVTVNVGKKKRKREIDTAANYVFYQVIKHKPENRIDAIPQYKYECYERTLFSLVNPPWKILNWKIFKPFRFIFKNTDTTAAGRTYIPGMLKETISDVYYRKKPYLYKKFIKADMVSGIDNSSVNKMIGYNFPEADIYANTILIAVTEFLSPFSNNAIGIYRYYLTDTAVLDGRVSYKLHFVGRVKEDQALKGFAWVDSATWAIRAVNFKPNEKANLNFVNDYLTEQEFTLVDNRSWVLSKEELVSTGSIFRKPHKMGLYITKVISKRNFETNIDFSDTIFSGPEEEIMNDSARSRRSEYFDTTRFEKISPQAARVYNISDSIKMVPAWQGYQWFGRLLTGAFMDAGPISIGRVLNFVSKNNVEGWRLRFGFETNPRFRYYTWRDRDNFLRKFYFYGYFAYGTKDRDWKYQALVRLNLPKKNERWNALEFLYRYDMRVPGQDENNLLLTFDNVVTLISGKTLSKIMKVREFRITYEQEWVKNFSTTTFFNEKTYYDIPGVFDFSRTVGDKTIRIPQFNVSEFSIDFRYAYKDVYFIGNFYRYPQKTRYPVLTFGYSAGVVNMANDFFNYHQFRLNYYHRVPWAAGFTNVLFRSGKILGNAPYTACFLTQGNLGILLDKFNYNLLREFEFISDQYASLWIEHHFNGFFFNKIPGFNKLRLREVIIFKGLIGTFDKKNAAVLNVPSELSQPFPVPYIETGFGIENIGYVLRVDFLWRATYRNKALSPTWGIKLGLNPRF